MSVSTAHEIGIVYYPGAQVACILGLTDLFGVASTIVRDQRRSGQSPLRVTHWQLLHSRDANLSCVSDSAPRSSPKPRTLIIPPTKAQVASQSVTAAALTLDGHMEMLRELRDKADQRGQTSAEIRAEELRGQLMRFYVKQVERGDAGDFSRHEH